jgi:hypothetical protein
VVRDRQMYPSQVGYDAERLVIEQWRAQALEAQQDSLTAIPGVVFGGRDWDEALDSLPWDDGEVLVVGSSRLGPVLVILGAAGVHLEENTPVA